MTHRSGPRTQSWPVTGPRWQNLNKQQLGLEGMWSRGGGGGGVHQQKKSIVLTQHSHVSADGLHYKGSGFTHNASLQAGTPGPDLLRPRLLTHRHVERTENKKEREEVSE